MPVDLKENFIYIQGGYSKIGLDITKVQQIISSLSLQSRIKSEYIEASSPLKDIYISSFYICKRLVTVEEFSLFVYETSYITESEKEGWGWVWENGWKKRNGVSWSKPFGMKADELYMADKRILPVMQVSWNDAFAYTEWITKKEGITVRIPSEAEWEIFAKEAGIISINKYKDNISSNIRNSTDYIKMLKNRLKESIYNTGLLWEWTADWYTGYSEYVNNRDFGNIYKVLRGGSLLSEEIQRTKEFRFRRCPTARSPYYGFRIVFNGFI